MKTEQEITDKRRELIAAINGFGLPRGYQIEGPFELTDVDLHLMSLGALAFATYSVGGRIDNLSILLDSMKTRNAEGRSMSHERPDYLDHRSLEGAMMFDSIMRMVPQSSQIEALLKTLDPAALANFTQIEQTLLRKAMESCNMDMYPRVKGDPHGERCSGDMLCQCGREYRQHPMDWRVIGYGDVPFLNVLCDGRRVKL